MKKLNRAIFIPLLAVLIFGGCEKTVNQTEIIAPPVEVYGRILANNAYPEGTGAAYLSIYNIIGIARMTLNGREVNTTPDSYYLYFDALNPGDTVHLSVEAVNTTGDSVFGSYETIISAQPELYGVVDDTFSITSPDSLTLHWSEVPEANKYSINLHLYYSWPTGDYDLDYYSTTVDTTTTDNYLTIPKEILFPDPSVFKDIDFYNGSIVITALYGESDPGDSSSFSGDIIGYIQVEVASPAYYLKIANGSKLLTQE